MTTYRAQINIVWLGWRIVLGLILSIGWVEASPSEAEEDLALGQQYQKGHDVPQDYAQAMTWYHKAADLGSAGAQNNIGALYQNGQGVSQDYAQAMSWFQKAAAQEDASAEYNIGFMYYMGHGVPQDDVQAMSWFKRAADHGDAKAQYSIGALYELNRGIPQDHSQAMNWFQKAASQGYAYAEYNVGLLYDVGEGVPQDYAQAMEWYQKAASQGVADAQNNIGALYEYGRGVPVDVKKALDCYKKAAANNSARAKSNLARLADPTPMNSGYEFDTVTVMFVFVVGRMLLRMMYPEIAATKIFLEDVIEIAPGIQGGNVRISLLGKATYVTQGQKSIFPQTLKKVFGWCQWMDESGHVLEMRKTKNVNKTFKTFQPARVSPDQQVFITNWGFTDKNKCVVIASTAAGQGYDCFIKYEIETGQVLGHVTERRSFADLPQWALWQLNPS